MKPRINLRSFLLQLVAGAVVWNLIFAVSAIVGSVIGVRFWPALMGWMWMGIVIVRIKNVPTITPANDRVDILSMVNLLWKALQWPRYLWANA